MKQHTVHIYIYIYIYIYIERERESIWRYTFSFQQENERLRGGAQTKRRSSFSSSDTGKPSPQITLKRHGSSESHHTLHCAGCAITNTAVGFSIVFNMEYDGFSFIRLLLCLILAILKMAQSSCTGTSKAVWIMQLSLTRHFDLQLSAFSHSFSHQISAKSFATFPRTSRVWSLTFTWHCRRKSIREVWENTGTRGRTPILERKRRPGERIDSIRSTLVSMRKKKREAKEKMKGATGEKASFPAYLKRYSGTLSK